MTDTLYIFGSCSGTEPFPGRRHCAFAIRHNERLYWFDAGENCSYAAHLMGVDAREIRAIFISHPHIDHIGGLANLIFNIRKLDRVNKTARDGRAIDAYMPDEVTLPSVMSLLGVSLLNYADTSFEVREHRVGDGAVFDEDGFSVEALHNQHLSHIPDGEKYSYSYRIRVGGKTIVFSGDVLNYSEIEPLLHGADVLLAETGHHRPAKVCRELLDMNCAPRHLMFIHHGRAILDEGQAAIDEAKAIYGGEMTVLNDGDTFDLSEM